MKIIDIEKSEDKIIIVKTAELNQKIEWIRNGFFFDILYEDTNPEVRLEIAKKSAYIDILKNDPSPFVKLEVLIKNGIEYMNFDNINIEHPIIIKEAIKQGFDLTKISFENNDLKLFILKYKGYRFCIENKIIEYYDDENFEIKEEMIKQGHKLLKNQIKGKLGALYINNLEQNKKAEIVGDTNNIDILKNVILNGYQIRDISSNKFSNLFRDREFRINCIKKGIYLTYILREYHQDKQTLLAFIENGFGLFDINVGKYVYNTIYYINKIIDVELIVAVKKYYPLSFQQLEYNEKILENIDFDKNINKILLKNKNVLSL